MYFEKTKIKNYFLSKYVSSTYLSNVILIKYFKNKDIRENI